MIPSHTMKEFVLLFIILFQPSCTQQDQANNYSSLEIGRTALSLKFSSGIRSIFEDSKGNFWFGSIQEGVCLYNGKSCTYFTDENGLCDNQILSIQEDTSGVIWFGTQKGVSSFNGVNMINHTPEILVDPPHIWMKTAYDLWFSAGTKEGIYRKDGKQIDYLPFPELKTINPYNIYAVTCLSNGKNEMLWIGTYAGVLGYNGKTFSIINDETLGLDIHTEPLHIRSLLEDSKGRLWIGNNGIGVLLKERDTIINFSENHHLIHPKSSRRGDKSLPGTLEHVFTITEDHQGNIWFGDRDTGVWKYDGTSMTNYTTKAGFTNDFALSIYEDTQNKLWFGMADGSIYTFNGKSFDKQF